MYSMTLMHMNDSSALPFLTLRLVLLQLLPTFSYTSHKELRLTLWTVVTAFLKSVALV